MEGIQGPSKCSAGKNQLVQILHEGVFVPQALEFQKGFTIAAPTWRELGMGLPPFQNSLVFGLGVGVLAREHLSAQAQRLHAAQGAGQHQLWVSGWACMCVCGWVCVWVCGWWVMNAYVDARSMCVCSTMV